MISVKILFIAFVCSRVANGFELICTFSQKREYSCDVQNLTIDQPNTLITSVSGTHEADHENSDVKYLGINDQSIKFLPNNIAKYFVNLRKIQVKNSKLEFITKTDFYGLTQLTQIVMEKNIIKELPCGVFESNKRLKQIHFEVNSLNKIGKNIFEPLPLLSVAHFRNNECVSKDVEKREDLPGLLVEIAKECAVNCDKSGAYPPSTSKIDQEHYKLVINELGNVVYKLDTVNENLDAELINVISEYEKLELEKDQLDEKLKELEINKLQIIADAKLKEEMLNNIISMRDKSIIENMETIKSLENTMINITAKLNQTIDEAKQNEDNLKSITLSRDNTIARLESNIQNINDTLEVAEKNWTIRCSEDQNTCYTKNFTIGVETSDSTNLKTFHEFKTDSEFRIENSKMKSLANSFFKHYPLMKFFFVTASDLRIIKNGNFLDASSLLQITITRNQIRFLGDVIFEGAKNVELINLGFNRIETVSNKAFIGLKKLKELNLSNNQIKLLRQDIFANLPSLEVLHMESNSIINLKGKLFRNNERLSRVYFNRNSLKNISPQIFQNLRFLVYMNLLDNSCINKEFKELKNTRMMTREIQQTCVQIGKIKLD